MAFDSNKTFWKSVKSERTTDLAMNTPCSLENAHKDAFFYKIPVKGTKLVCLRRLKINIQLHQFSLLNQIGAVEFRATKESQPSLFTVSSCSMEPIKKKLKFHNHRLCRDFVVQHHGL